VAARKALTAARSDETSNATSRQAAIERSVSSIGPRVREQRRVRGLSLQQAAALAGVSAASIHKVERGDMVPTVTTLLKLAGAFELPLSSFVDDTVSDGAGAQVVREADRTPVPSPWSGTTRASVTTGTGPFRLAGEVHEVAAGTSGELPADPGTGERLWYVLDGSLEVTTGAAPVVVRAGDSLQVRGDRPVTWRNTSRRVARVLHVDVPNARS
jgi:DNA-binding XRE family transcriptional regulator/quercetin dioxygenase-like cupin family protein